MPDDTIMDMVNNIEPFYNDKNGLYRKWVQEGEEWSETQAWKEARALAAHFAEAIEASPHYRGGRYGDKDFDEAATEMIEEFKTEERPKWSVGCQRQAR